MQVLVNSDHHIAGGASVSERVETIVTDAVDRFDDRLTRVEVHLSDVNGPKHGEREKRCMMEARIGGLHPLAVKHTAPTLLEAIEGAADKLERALDHTLGRLKAGHKKPLRELATDGLGAEAVDMEELDNLEASEGEGLDGSDGSATDGSGPDAFVGDGRSDTTH